MRLEKMVNEPAFCQKTPRYALGLLLPKNVSFAPGRLGGKEILRYTKKPSSYLTFNLKVSIISSSPLEGCPSG